MRQRETNQRFLREAATRIVSLVRTGFDFLSPVLLIVVLCGTLSLAVEQGRALIEVDTSGAPIRMYSGAQPPSADTVELMAIISALDWKEDAATVARVEVLSRRDVSNCQRTPTGECRRASVETGSCAVDEACKAKL